MENYLIEIFLYIPIALVIAIILLDRYIFKDKTTTIGDVLIFVFICFIPVINIIMFVIGFIKTLTESDILDKKIWK